MIRKKLKLSVLRKSIVPSDYEFKGWSPDGEYFAFSRMEWNTNNILKTIIFNKNGQVFKNIEGAIHLWFPDSKNILAVFSEIDFEKLNILTGGKIRLNIYQGSHERAVEDFIYCINVDRGSILYSVDENIYEYEIATGEPRLLHRAENWQITRLFSFKNLLFYTVHCCDAEYKNCKYKNYKFDISNGKLENIFPIVNDFHCFVPNNNKIVIYFSVMGDRNLYFYDHFSKLLGKINGFPYYPQNESGIYFEDSSFAPNGKIFAASLENIGDDEEDIKSADILLINLQGKFKQITDTKDKKELVKGWSPEGAKILYYDAAGKKYYLTTISK